MERGAPADRLDELRDAFVAGGYAPEGAEIEGEDTATGEHGHGAHGGEDGSVREVEYRGHRIRIVTRYEVAIDGEPWNGSLQVTPEGGVMTHDLPQYVAPSALDIARAVVDQSYEAPEEIRAALLAAREGLAR